MFQDAKSWPFQEARNLLAHIAKKGKQPGDMVTFETGYGPSGAPHIGTFGEVVRTLWVMRAFNEITQHAYQTRLIMFSDDYDAMRKVPDDMPAWLNDYLGQPLSNVPNPYNDSPEASFAAANNMKLVDFVDDILENYDGSTVGSSPRRSRVSFVSSTEYYQAGTFNDMLDRVWDNYTAIQAIMLPTLGEERRATYSAFMPVSSTDGQVLQTGVSLAHVSDHRALRYTDELGITCHHGIYDGKCKLQWKVDWAMRWRFFDVDYEMSGKDLIDSVKLSSQICKVLGGTPPLNLTYELFLDEQGAKISKSKGNGFTVDQWLTYGSTGSLQLFMFQNPRAAKKLYRELIPTLEDQYIAARQNELTPNDPVWHFKVGSYEHQIPNVSFSLMLNLAIVAQTKDAQALISYLSQSQPIDQHGWLSDMAGRVVRYANDVGLFDRELREPTPVERQAFNELAERFSAMLPDMDAEAFQFQVYEVGKKYDFQPLRAWFQALYECFLGSSSGPRFGAFTAAYGLEETIAMLRKYEVVTPE